MRRKKILLQTDFSLAKTGFGRYAHTLLSYLYKTGKYDLVHYCAGISRGTPMLEATPWKSIGAIPDDPKIMEKRSRDPREQRMVSYGSHYLDEVIKEEKPDIYIASQDIWGVDFAIKKSWFKNISSVIWTTLDSLPILPSAVKAASQVQNYWIWSNFATKELHRLGHTHALTFHGPIDHEKFFRLEDAHRASLRDQVGIPQDTFLIGYVFRNQLRKSVPNLLEGYKMWKENHKDVKAGLLLHTHFSEGWNIMRMAREYNVDPNDIYTSYVCESCKGFEVKVFAGERLPCRFCNAPNSLVTTSPALGISEEQLNVVYNLMDVYCHPFTSGGQEIPIQEAKFAELITLVTNYSCGEDMCEKDAASLPLEWSEYREHDTEFRKASTKPESIAGRLEEVFNMPPAIRKEFGRQAREWTIENYSIKEVGPTLETIFDNFPYADYDFDQEEEQKDPTAPIQNIEDNAQWLIHMYKEILKYDLDETDEGHQYWMQELGKGVPRQSIERYFRETALRDITSFDEEQIVKLLGEEDEGKRILVAVPDSKKDVLLTSALLPSMKSMYPEYNIYFATNPNFFEMLDGNKHIYKVLPFIDEMGNPLWAEGSGDTKGKFEICFLPTIDKSYTHNGKDKLELCTS